MTFEYNVNVDLIPRVKMVRDEIIKQYPLIEETAAVIAASLASSLDDKPTNADKFERCYFILMNLSPTNDEYIHVFNDMYDLYEDGIDNDVYNSCMKEIIKFISHERTTFPLLEEFY